MSTNGSTSPCRSYSAKTTTTGKISKYKGRVTTQGPRTTDCTRNTKLLNQNCSNVENLFQRPIQKKDNISKRIEHDGVNFPVHDHDNKNKTFSSVRTHHDTKSNDIISSGGRRSNTVPQKSFIRNNNNLSTRTITSIVQNESGSESDKSEISWCINHKSTCKALKQFHSSKLLYTISNLDCDKLPKSQMKYLWQKQHGCMLVVWNEKTPNLVHIFNQKGVHLKQIGSDEPNIDFAWSPEGRLLALVCSGSNKICIWDSKEGTTEQISSQLNDTGGCLAWKQGGKSIIFASSTGNLFKFDLISHRFSRDIGVHSSEIICAAWSNDGVLALTTKDYILSLHKKDAGKFMALSGRPSDLKYGQMECNSWRPGVENTLSIIINHEKICLVTIEENLNPTAIEFAFRSEYGLIQSYQWRCNDSILILFSLGYLITISTKLEEIGEQIQLIKLLSDVICSTMCNITSKVAICFKEKFEIREGLSPDLISTEEFFKSSSFPVSCSMGENGQLLAVLTKCADLEIFLIAVPLLGDFMGNYIVHMTSLDKLSIKKFLPSLIKERELKLEVQPSILSVGPLHFVVVFDNRAWFYSFLDVIKNKLDKPCLVREYKSTVHQISLNLKYCACRCQDKLFLHMIFEDTLQDDFKCFPGETSGLTRINCFTLTTKLLIFGGNDGIVKIFDLETKLERNAVTITNGKDVSSIIPDATESIAVITDEERTGYIYDMVKECNYIIPDFPKNFDGILWESEISSKHIFLTYSIGCHYVNVFVFWQDVASGYKLYKAGKFNTFDAIDIKPLCLKNSVIYSQISSGTLVSSVSFSEHQPEDLDPEFGALSKLDRLLVLKKYSDAEHFCDYCDLNEFWEKLAEKALVNLDFDTATEAYLKVGKVGIAVDLDTLCNVEDSDLFLGHISLIFGKFKRAEKHYLRSSEKSAAVLLKTYLHEWDDAFSLAKEFSPDMICVVSKEYAVSEEGRGNYLHALELFEQVLKHANMKHDPTFISECKAGLARNYIRCGQHERGLELVQSFTEIKYILNCAEVLVAKKYNKEAAKLFESCNEWNKAASLYIVQKDWKKFDATISKITSSNIFRQYAQVKELDGDFIGAAFGYERISDLGNTCRVFLKGNQPDEAIRLAKMSESFEAVKTVCNFFLEKEDAGTAMRFLVLSGHFIEAVSIALIYDRIDLYISTLLDSSPKTTPVRVSKEYIESLELIAKYCMEMNQGIRAARCFLLSSNPISAFNVLMETARNGHISSEIDFLNLFIETAQCLNNPEATTMITDYYSGRLDGIPKNPRLILKLALQLEHLDTAASISISVARKEQESGNYLAAHCTLLLVLMEMKFKGLRIPRENIEILGIIHIYMLSRIHISRGNNDTAARLLARLSYHSHQFPAHVVQLLTTTTIQCLKAGLKESAMTACFKLMTPENRPNIDPKYKRKFELMLRKFSKTVLEDTPDNLTPCPFCKTLLYNFELFCKTCDTLIPFCIASGRHVTSDDLTCCPACKFPAIHNEFVKFLKEDEFTSVCPMCDTILNPDDLIQIHSPDKYLMTFLPKENSLDCKNINGTSSTPSS